MTENQCRSAPREECPLVESCRLVRKSSCDVSVEHDFSVKKKECVSSFSLARLSSRRIHVPSSLIA